MKIPRQLNHFNVSFFLAIGCLVLFALRSFSGNTTPAEQLLIQPLILFSVFIPLLLKKP